MSTCGDAKCELPAGHGGDTHARRYVGDVWELWPMAHARNWWAQTIGNATSVRARLFHQEGAQPVNSINPIKEGENDDEPAKV